MFTLEQIKAAHSKVKSGADFPDYVQDIIKLGLVRYDIYVIDGHADYFAKDDLSIQSTARYNVLSVADQSNPPQFLKYLKQHQQGQTDYAAFCRHAAETGVEKWTVDTTNMTCAYYDKAGNQMLVEVIPAP